MRLETGGTPESVDELVAPGFADMAEAASEDAASGAGDNPDIAALLPWDKADRGKPLVLLRGPAGS